MDNLRWELKQLSRSVREGSYATQAARAAALDQIARQLRENGFMHMRVTSLKPKHVEFLVHHWQTNGVTVGTIKNRLAHVRWWADKIGNPALVPKSNEKLGIESRSYVSEGGKQLVLDHSKLEDVQDDRVRLSLELQAAFGLRREESIKFQPSYAIRDGELHLKKSWTKGGRPRTVPIRTDIQRELLARVSKIAGNGSLIPPEKSYVQHLRVYERELRDVGISRAHGLRHAYAQVRYFELTGWRAPHAGGPQSADLTAEQKVADLAARLTISDELGHGREEITAVYLGR